MRRGHKRLRDGQEDASNDCILTMSNKGVTRGYKERRGNIYNPKLYTGDPADLLRIPSGSIAHLYDAFCCLKRRPSRA